MPDELPRRFGKYLLLRRLAVGGMAELFLARKSGPADLSVEKELVIKRILPDFGADEDFRAMFLNEARLAALLNHALVVRTYDLGRAEDTLFIAMEYVDGVNLRDLGKTLRRAGKGVPHGVVATVGAKIGEALDYAHRLTSATGQPLKLVHRDVSPDNIMLTRDGSVKLADFGIAKAFSLHPTTRTHTVKGKLNYMSPEHLTGAALDGRSDLYSLGVTLYSALSGRFPFSGSNHVAVMEAIVGTPAPPLSQVTQGIAPELEHIVMRLLEKAPDRRYATGADLSLELQKFAASAGLLLTARGLSEFVASTEALERGPGTPEAPAPPPASPQRPHTTLLDDDAPSSPPLEPMEATEPPGISPFAQNLAASPQESAIAPPRKPPSPPAAAAPGDLEKEEPTITGPPPGAKKPVQAPPSAQSRKLLVPAEKSEWATELQPAASAPKPPPRTESAEVRRATKDVPRSSASRPPSALPLPPPPPPPTEQHPAQLPREAAPTELARPKVAAPSAPLPPRPAPAPPPAAPATPLSSAAASVAPTEPGQAHAPPRASAPAALWAIALVVALVVGALLVVRQLHDLEEIRAMEAATQGAATTRQP